MNAHPERIGPYKILRSIGEGGFGQVFEGFHESLQRRAAVKVLLPEKLADRDTVARFVREARALATFEGYRGIVQVQHFEPPGQEAPYLALELLDGKTLRQWLTEQGGNIDLNHALEMARQIAAIMVDVHAKEFVHRDLKPENIIPVSDEQAQCHLRTFILHFGIAQVTYDPPFDDQSLTQVKTTSTNILGSLVYIAPEQILDADMATPKADVYTLGLIVYEMISGNPPFVSDSAIKLVQMHGRDEPKPLRSVVPNVPSALSTFITSMLAKKPEDRPSMRDCQAMLARDFSFDDQTCPFPGLQPFDQSLAHLFFGRREEQRFVLGKLDELREDSTRRWLQIQGPSGTGKSSFVHAALLPRLNATEWATIKMRPGEDPIRALTEALASVYGKSERVLVDSFRNEPDALDVFLQEGANSKTKVLLVVDQFEELFALGAIHIATFERLLRHAFKNPESPLRLLTTIRSDYLHRFDLALDLAKLLDTFAVRYDLRPMDEEALSEVIGKMAGRAGLRLTDGLPRRMVEDATGNDYRLPLLGHTLRSLWSSRVTEEITHAHYEEMGGVGGTLAKQAKELLESESLGPGGREAAKWMLLDLVHVGQGAPDTRRPRMRAEIDLAVGKSEDALRAWKCLSGEEANAENREPFRLLVTSGDAAEPEKQRVELVHEMILHKVSLVVEWINAERDFLELLLALESAAQAWLRTEKKDGLPSGTLLEHYRGGKEEARQARVMRMGSERAREFLNEALRAEKRKRRIQIGIGALLVVMMVGIVVSAGIAVQARNRAQVNLEEVLKTTDQMINVVDWRLGRIAHTFHHRAKIMNNLHRQLLALENDEPAKVRIRIVDSFQRWSDIERLYGKLDDADRFTNESEQRIKLGLTENSTNLEWVWLQAMNLSKRGKVKLFKGDAMVALDAFNESIQKFEALRNTKFSDEEALATSHIEKGDALRALGDIEDAHKSYTYGLDIRRRLAEAKSEKDLSYEQAMLAEALIARSQVAPNVVAAMSDLNEALTIADSLVDKEDYNLLYRSIRTTVYLRLSQNNLAATSTAIKSAYEDAVFLNKSAPEHKEYALLLIEAWVGLEKARRETGDIGGAKEVQAERCKIIQDFAQRDGEDKRFEVPGECR